MKGRLVLAEMAKNGLQQGENNLQVYVMCELPSNVIMAEEFVRCLMASRLVPTI